jgi:hypothetical protein
LSRLEDAWNDSEWEVTWFDDLSGVWWKRDFDDRFDYCLVVESAPGLRFVAGLVIGDDECADVLCESIEEARDVAEAMFRQWAHDEYGTVLP